jgi:hypothetical protein
MHTNTWQANSSALQSINAPIPLSLSVPAGYSQTTKPGIILINPSTVTFQLSPPLVIPKDSNCSLISASFCFSQPNIAGLNDGVFNIMNGNNRISIGFGGPLVDYYVPLGLYSVADLQLALNQIARDPAQGWVTTPVDLFILTGISATQKIVFTLNPAALNGGVFPVGDLVISFQNPGVMGNNDSMGGLLGFTPTLSGPTITGPGTPPDNNKIVSQLAPDVSNFANISAYNLYLSFLTGSYQNNTVGQLLYSFPIGPYSPNSIISVEPKQRFPVQCNSSAYSTVNVWTTDQEGNPLPWKYYQSPFSFSCLISKNKPDGSI